MRPDVKIVSRDEAQSRGWSKFFTGVPCKHGHLAERYVSNGGCEWCINRRVRVAMSAPNVFHPPSGYALPGHIDASRITPNLISDLHAQVLMELPRLINAAERRTERKWPLSNRYTWDASKAGGHARETMLAAGYDDAKLMEMGALMYVGDQTPPR